LTVCGWLALYELNRQESLFSKLGEHPPHLFIDDFTQFYAMGQLVGSDRRDKLYDPRTQDEFLNRILSPRHTTKIFFAQNVPWLFCVMVPFTAFPLATAYLFWNVLQVLCAALGLALICRDVRKMTTLSTALLIAGATACQPAWLNFERGNTAWFVVAFLCIYTWALIRQRDLPGGIALALSAQKPQYAILAAIPALTFRRWRLIGYAAGTELILWLMAGFQVGFPNILGYPSMLLQADANTNYDGHDPLQHVNLRAFLIAHLSHSVGMTAGVVIFVVGVVALGLLWLRVGKVDGELFRWTMALTLTSAVVISPHACVYDITLLSIPAALTLVPGSDQEPAVARVCFWLWTALLASFPLTSWGLYLMENLDSRFQHEPLAMINAGLLVVCLAAYYFVSKRSPAEERPAA